MGQAWAAVIQVIFVCLLFLPGVKAVYSWYLLISQIAPWLALIFKANEGQLRMAIYAAWWICLSTLILAFVSWTTCKTLTGCTNAAIGAGATLAVALGLCLTNVHMLNMQEEIIQIKAGKEHKD